MTQRRFHNVQVLGPYSIGEIPSAFQVTITDDSNNAIDLTGFTAEFVIEAVDETIANLGLGTSDITNEVGGVTQYQWVATDFANAGHFRAQMWVGNGTVRYASDVFEWFVRDTTDAPSV